MQSGNAAEPWPRLPSGRLRSGGLPGGGAPPGIGTGTDTDIPGAAGSMGPLLPLVLLAARGRTRGLAHAVVI